MAGAKTRGEEMLALRKARMDSSLPFLRGGFRPFFFGGAAWAIIALVLWLLSLLGGLTLPSAFDPLAWHRHEMLFGFVGAIVAGFLLTAIPNWTGRLPIASLPLAALFALWLSGRIALLWSGDVGLTAAAALDVGFYVVFAFVAGREVLAAKNRNLPIAALVLLFGAANAVDYAGVAGWLEDSEAGFRAGIALVTVMISLIGGRIIPSFTRNWMVKQGLKDHAPGQPTRFDLITIGVTGIGLLLWVLAPSASFTGWLLLLAGFLQLVRMVRWSGWRTLSDPLVAILHVGYLWLPVGLLLLAWSILGESMPRTVALHALTAGAMASMILAVMTRATLGHTGRELKAGAGTITIYIFVTTGAVLRVGAGLGLISYRVGIEGAGAFWAGAFLLFLLIYGPILFRARHGA
ncbi:NnrS family protein [Sphingopyxis sp. SE2]|uniref:NnrS family protein n=1 Tax=Sphingopyxis sp. SE2 TaxID=1586240 RepID=UPI0028C26000|nr:NnrS family protein [Sphingopyxis sp. SE2]MDT7527779.1 NnrS family protein [Sphingopyxis sp. SE2]